MNKNTKPKESGVTISPASESDVRTVAWTVLTALDIDAEHLDWMEKSCADENSMYSFNKSMIARIDGVPVGCVVSYSGDDYLSLREYTWPRLWEDADSESVNNSEIEAFPGEYYLDSMAILPEYRGRNIGKILMEAAIGRGRSLGYKNFSLLVDVDKPRLQSYYESLGFSVKGEVTFMGHRFNRMTLTDK